LLSFELGNFCIITIKGSLVKFFVKSLIHADSNKEEEWFNGQDDNASHDPDLAINILTFKIFALVEEIARSAKNTEMEY
jgi:hypothetical protein